MSRLLRSPVFHSLRHYMLALLMLALIGLFITSHTRGSGNGVVSNAPSPASYFDPSLYTPEQLNFSTINDGIPDVWKDYYGFSLADPDLAQADYNGTGTTNLVKYLANLWPLDTTPPQPQTTPPAAKKAAAPTAKAAASPADDPNNLIKGGSFSTLDLPLPNHQSTGYLGGGFHWGYVPEDKITGGWKALKGDKIEIWKTDSGKQFVELNANATNSGIEQKVTSIQPGTYLLTWSDMGRESDKADGSNYSVYVFTKKKTQDTADNEKNAGALEGRTDILKPHLETSGKRGDWKQKVVAFTVTAQDLKNNNFWIAFKPKGEAITYGALIDDIILAPVEVVKPVIGNHGEMQRDANFKPVMANTNELAVAKMNESLRKVGKAPYLNIENDADQFRIRIPGIATVATVSIKIATVENPDSADPDGKPYDEGEREINLTKENEVYQTPSLLLTSDSTDDEYSEDGVGVDNQTNDKSYKMQLGGKLKITSVIINGAECKIDKRVPVPIKKTVHIAAVVLADAGVTEDTVKKDILFTNERYAQVGIRLVLDSVTYQAVPAIFNLPSRISKGTVIMSGARSGPVSGDARILLDTYSTTSTIADIQVFYVKGTVQYSTRLSLNGFSMPEFAFSEQNGQGNSKYANNVFIQGPHAFQTLAHELGHILTNNGHYGIDYDTEVDTAVDRDLIQYNLMRLGGMSYSINTNKIYRPKRLTPKQQKWMYKHRSIQ